MSGKRDGSYLRASTGEQSIETQRMGLVAACECGAGGLSGSSRIGGSRRQGWRKAPRLPPCAEGGNHPQDDVVAAWSVDRLGRSLQDLVGFLGELSAVGCDLYLERQAVDTTTPAGRALFQMLGVRGVRTLNHPRAGQGWDGMARKHGTRSGKPIGQPPISQGQGRGDPSRAGARNRHPQNHPAVRDRR